jgi:hypothetical protein
MSLGRSEERWEEDRDGAELPGEEPEDVDGESGGVGRLSSPSSSNGRAMGHLKGRETAAGEVKGWWLGGVWARIKEDQGVEN